MPDITMCLSNNCARFLICYRAQATPSKLQSYSDFSTYCNRHSSFCEYIPMERSLGNVYKRLEEE